MGNISILDESGKHTVECCVCRNLFNAKFPHQVTCSPECRKKHTRDKARNRPVDPNTKRRHDRKNARQGGSSGRIYVSAALMSKLESRFDYDPDAIQHFVETATTSALDAL